MRGHLLQRAVLPALAFVCASAFAADTNHLLVHVEGRGAPTVILTGGLGDTLDVWNRVQPAIATDCARTFAYNRAGYVGSYPASGPRDAETIVSELRSELQRRGIRPPYVLVGHSIGGLYMQYFARTHPGEVTGLLLVDSTHWNQGLRMDTASTAPYMGQRTVVLFMSFITRREFADSALAGEQVHSSPHSAALPTIVLSATRSVRGETPASRVTAARLQEEIAADFPGARHVRVPESGHYIHRDRPDVVVNAARELAGCGPIRLAATSPGPPTR
jgi:pimeloyl-ACP methyl ester carboxylesterase